MGGLVTEDAPCQALCAGRIRPAFQLVWHTPGSIPVEFEVLAAPSLRTLLSPRPGAAGWRRPLPGR